jgi:hypothetical protein
MKKLSGVEGRLDTAWSLLVKLRAGNKCEYCGNRSYLNSHHIFTRKNRATRWDTNNGMALCPSHHTLDTHFSAHGTPTIFTEWIISKRSEQWHTLLRIKANSTSKLHPFEKELLLKELNKEIQKHAN